MFEIISTYPSGMFWVRDGKSRLGTYKSRADVEAAAKPVIDGIVSLARADRMVLRAELVVNPQTLARSTRAIWHDPAEAVG